MPAGFVCRAAVFAQQGLGEMAGEGGFAGVLLAGKEQGVRQLVAVFCEAAPVGFVPGINHVRSGGRKKEAHYNGFARPVSEVWQRPSERFQTASK